MLADAPAQFRRSAPATRRASGRAQPGARQQFLHHARRRHHVLVGEGLVIAFDLGEIVLIVDHHAVGLGEALLRQIAHRIDPFEPRAVAEMEARDRIDDASVGPPDLEEVMRRQRLERLAHARRGLGAFRPSVLERDVAHGLDQRLDRGIVAAFHPAPEARDGRQRHEGLDLRQFATDLLDHLLDQEIAEAHAGKALLAIRDRVEGRGAGLVLGDVGPPLGEQRRDRGRRRHRQRDLDEDQGLVDQGRMEERIAAPIDRIDAAPQVVPAADLVHRLVADDLLQAPPPERTSRSAAAPESRG